MSQIGFVVKQIEKVMDDEKYPLSLSQREVMERILKDSDDNFPPSKLFGNTGRLTAKVAPAGI
jgi:hypothetical protein